MPTDDYLMKTLQSIDAATTRRIVEKYTINPGYAYNPAVVGVGQQAHNTHEPREPTLGEAIAAMTGGIRIEQAMNGGWVILKRGSAWDEPTVLAALTTDEDLMAWMQKYLTAMAEERAVEAGG